jgi:hypothetical protein
LQSLQQQSFSILVCQLIALEVSVAACHITRHARYGLIGNMMMMMPAMFSQTALLCMLLVAVLHAHIPHCIHYQSK